MLRDMAPTTARSRRSRPVTRPGPVLAGANPVALEQIPVWRELVPVMDPATSRRRRYGRAWTRSSTG